MRVSVKIKIIKRNQTETSGTESMVTDMRNSVEKLNRWKNNWKQDNWNIEVRGAERRVKNSEHSLWTSNIHPRGVPGERWLFEELMAANFSNFMKDFGKKKNQSTLICTSKKCHEF